jgi:hypothetical protein
MKRPFSVTLLAFGVLSFTGVNILRLVEAVRQWQLLTSLPLEISPLYLALTGLFWGLLGFIILWGFWRGRPWGPFGLRILAVAFAIFFWFDRLFLVQIPSRTVNWPFLLGVTILILFFVFWSLAQKPVKQYFGEMHDRQSENSTPT